MKARGFTLAELAFVTALAALVAGALIARVVPLLGRAERVQYLKTEAELRSALLLEAATRIARGDSTTLIELSRSNPIDLLPAPPSDYVGQAAWTETTQIPRPSWHFDAARGTLVYRVGPHTSFEAVDGPADTIELAVVFRFDDRNANGVFEPGIDTFHRLDLAPLNAYLWPERGAL